MAINELCEVVNFIWTLMLWKNKLPQVFDFSLVSSFYIWKYDKVTFTSWKLIDIITS